MSLQGTKGLHDDGNGPSTFTLWQNLGEVPRVALHLEVFIRGCAVHIPAPLGKVVQFMGWLPHRTRLHNPDGSGPWMGGIHATRVHHTAYSKIGTEYATWVLREYLRRNAPMQVYNT